MSWIGRYRLRTFLAGSLWPVPVLGMCLALAAAPLVRRLDAAVGWTFFGFGTDGARAILTGLVASVFTFLVFVFSILLVAVQIASSNLSPRVIAGFLAHRPVRVCLGLLVFTFVFGIAVLGRIEGAAVPQLPVTIVIASSLGCIVAFLYLIDHLAKRLRPVSVVSDVGRDGARVIASIYPEKLGSSGEEKNPPGLDVDERSRARTVLSRTGGVVLAFDVVGLVAEARASDSVLELVPQVGDFVAKGDPLFRVLGGRELPGGALLQHVALGAERTIEQDPAFPFRIIVDIASKALSPAINDPTTAVLALDQLHHLLRNLGARKLDTGRVRDADGHLRLLYRTPDWDAFVELATTEIRHFGATSIQVARRLRAMLDDLIAVVPPGRRPPLEAELQRLQRSTDRAFADPEDRARAERGDTQGLGGQ